VYLGKPRLKYEDRNSSLKLIKGDVQLTKTIADCWSIPRRDARLVIGKHWIYSKTPKFPNWWQMTCSTIENETSIYYNK
ncbi:hypothetical protein NDU88_002338, partial [Pleurodeles waltl]